MLMLILIRPTLRCICVVCSWANLRRKHTGRDEPHDIKLWGLGNESESEQASRIHA
jgi:hypothetical protein